MTLTHDEFPIINEAVIVSIKELKEFRTSFRIWVQRGSLTELGHVNEAVVIAVILAEDFEALPGVRDCFDI